MKRAIIVILFLVICFSCSKEYQDIPGELSISYEIHNLKMPENVENKLNSSASNVVFYPNPFRDLVFLNSALKIKEIVLTNSKGDYIIITEPATNYAFDFSAEDDGSYYCEVVLMNDELYRFYLIKLGN